MVGAAGSRGARDAGLYMRKLLLTTYNTRWLRYSERTQRDQVNALAVARVIADHVRDAPTATRGGETESYKIKDLVYRAFRGEGMSRETLDLMREAFHLSEEHAAQALALWEGSTPSLDLKGSMAPQSVASSSSPPYQTVQRYEFHYVGPNGQPERHRTVQTIKALVDGYSVHRYLFDTSEAEVERILGGTPTQPYCYNGDIWAVDIQLSKLLNVGETLPMEFVTKFHNIKPFPPNFRYAAHQRITDILWRLEFHPKKLPRSVSWVEWQDYRPPNDIVNYSEPVELDTEFSVSRRLESIESATAGFAWEF